MDAKLQAIDCRWLFALYGIIPLSLAVIAADSLWLNGELLHRYLPSDPQQWPFWTVIFGLPHIIASMLTMADREYLSHYRHTLFWPLVLFAGIASAGYIGPQPISLNLLFVFLAFYTVYHVLAQQLGLTLMMMGIPPTRTFRVWKWLALFSGFAVYIIVYGQHRLGEIAVGPYTLYEVLAAVAGVLTAGVIVLALRLSRASRHAIGTWYLWANVALIVSAFLINEIGYTLFVILIPRIIHDVTAYTVYITHDTNRNKAKPRNLIYRILPFALFPPLLLLPVLSIGIAYALSTVQHYPLISILILTVSFLHYYFEGFIWRGNHPHRQHLAFTR